MGIIRQERFPRAREIAVKGNHSAGKIPTSEENGVWWESFGRKDSHERGKWRLTGIIREERFPLAGKMAVEGNHSAEKIPASEENRFYGNHLAGKIPTSEENGG